MTTRARASLVRAAALLLAAVVATAGATSADELRIHASGGVAFPLSPAEFSDFWKTGFSVGGGIGVWSSPCWEIVGSFHFQRHTADRSRQAADLLLEGMGLVSGVRAIEGRDAKVVTLTAEVRFHIPTESSSMSPFLAFGAGYFGISTTDARVTPELEGLDPVTVLGDQDDAFGATFGAGVEAQVVSRVRLVFDSIYTIGFTERVSTQFLPLRLGLVLR
jgi:hypothetical protein